VILFATASRLAGASTLTNLGSVAAIVAAVLLVATIAALMIRRKLFPRLKIEIYGKGFVTPQIEKAPGLVMPVRLHVFKMRVTSLEPSRGAALTVHYYQHVVAGNPRGLTLVPVPTGIFAHDAARLESQFNVAHETIVAGDLLFDPTLAQGDPGKVGQFEIRDHISGRAIRIPADIGTHQKRFWERMRKPRRFT